jgi:hypothetical protein
MKHYLLLLLASTCLSACGKSDEEPRGIKAAFEQEFDLFYKQKASLDNITAPELTVKMDQLEYQTIPDDVVCCFGPCAWWRATVLVSDTSGSTQTYTVNSSRGRSTKTWLDSLHVRANGATYVVYVKAMKPGLEDKKTKIQYRSVQLVVSRPQAL